MTSPLFPPIEPYKKHFLTVSSIHKIYLEECGNPKGQPILFLHGGPGGGTDPDHRRLYDPQLFRIILFDQRGCGQSTPFAELKENTTWDLVKDIETIRQFLGIDQWLVHGGSWGTTLALVYAINHSQAVKGLILRGIFLCTTKELQWFYQEGAHWIFPDAWEPYEALIPKEERHDYISSYYKRLISDNEELRLKAAQVWSQWEASTSNLIPNFEFVKKYGDPVKALPFARIEAHYFVNKAFLPTDNYILENCDKIKHIPTKIIHGRYDVVCPFKNAWDLHRLLPLSELKIIPDAGHSLFEPKILTAVVEACHDFIK